MILSCNRLRRLPDNLADLPNLKVLYLDDNDLSYLPVSLIRCPHLESLWLRSDQKIYNPSRLTFTNLNDITVTSPYLHKINEKHRDNDDMVFHSNENLVMKSKDDILATVPVDRSSSVVEPAKKRVTWQAPLVSTIVNLTLPDKVVATLTPVSCAVSKHCSTTENSAVSRETCNYGSDGGLYSTSEENDIDYNDVVLTDGVVKPTANFYDKRIETTTTTPLILQSKPLFISNTDRSSHPHHFYYGNTINNTKLGSSSTINTASTNRPALSTFSRLTRKTTPCKIQTCYSSLTSDGFSSVTQPPLPLISLTIADLPINNDGMNSNHSRPSNEPDIIKCDTSSLGTVTNDNLLSVNNDGDSALLEVSDYDNNTPLLGATMRCNLNSNQPPENKNFTTCSSNHVQCVAFIELNQHKVKGNAENQRHLGMTIAGGINSCRLYRPNDAGIFVSDLTQDGLAYQAGLSVGDKLLSLHYQQKDSFVSNQDSRTVDLVNCRHDTAVYALREFMELGIDFMITYERCNDISDIAMSGNNASNATSEEKTEKLDVDNAVIGSHNVMVLQALNDFYYRRKLSSTAINKDDLSNLVSNGSPSFACQEFASNFTTPISINNTTINQKHHMDAHYPLPSNRNKVTQSCDTLLDDTNDVTVFTDVGMTAIIDSNDALLHRGRQMSHASSSATLVQQQLDSSSSALSNHLSTRDLYNKVVTRPREFKPSSVLRTNRLQSPSVPKYSSMRHHISSSSSTGPHISDDNVML